MSKTKQSIYSAEFKESAIKLANESKVPKAQVARELANQ
jgi:transposase-like protein